MCLLRSVSVFILGLIFYAFNLGSFSPRHDFERGCAALTVKKKESKFQSELIRDIYRRFPDSIVLKNDPNYMQGIPDLTILYRGHWATLECKRSMDSDHEPNQDYYVSTMDDMSFSRFVCPENVEEVLDELEQAFQS